MEQRSYKLTSRVSNLPRFLFSSAILSSKLTHYAAHTQTVSDQHRIPKSPCLAPNIHHKPKCSDLGYRAIDLDLERPHRLALHDILPQGSNLAFR